MERGLKIRRALVGSFGITTLLSGLATSVPAQQLGEPEAGEVWQEVSPGFVGEAEVEPEAASEADGPTIELSVDEAEAVHHSLLAMRERMARRIRNAPSEPAELFDTGESAVDLEETYSDAELVGEVDTPENLIIGRNSRNTQAQLAGNSTLAEPAAANNGPLVFASGNFAHAEFSRNGGTTWTNVPLPGGPADAPILCCDHDVVIDDARRTVFHSALYVRTNADGDPVNGVVRIFVRRQIDSTTATCSYRIDPAGTADNIVPDYPHLGLTRRFLYLTINATGSGGGFARIYRFNIDQLDNCETTNFRFFDQRSPRRVWVPAEGTNNFTTTFWVQHDSASIIRVFRWNEDNDNPQQVTRTIQTTQFTNPDCRGGIGNFDWIERATAFSISGFRHRCTLAAGALSGESALACYWNAGPTGSITQGHVRASVFKLSDLSVIAQPHIFNANFCFGFPAVTANKRGDIGISIALGGRAGGGGTAVRSGVGIDDEFTSGLGFFDTIFTTASGSANRRDGRFGDYFTIHPYEPCEKWFSATNYAWDGVAPVDNPNDVNYRYVEFGREQSRRCYESHRDQVPVQ